MSKADYYISHFFYYTLTILLGIVCFISLKWFVQEYSACLIIFGVVCILGGIIGYAVLIRELYLNSIGENTD